MPLNYSYFVVIPLPNIKTWCFQMSDGLMGKLILKYQYVAY